MAVERSDAAARPARLRLPAVDLRAQALRLARTLAARVPALAAGVAASVPVIRSTVKAVHAGWVPAGDDGIIATRGWDVLTAHTPLVGQYSEAGLVIRGQVLHSPGPMLYWLLALPARFGSVASIAVTMCALNTLAIVGCVVLARRRGGLLLMFAVAAAIALMCQSLAGEVMHDIWNPAAALFPFLLLIFLCWSLACGERRLLPLVALVASYVVQTHLAYAAPTAVLLAVGLGGLLLGRLRWRGAASARPAPLRSLLGSLRHLRDRRRTGERAVVGRGDAAPAAPPTPTPRPTRTPVRVPAKATAAAPRSPRVWPWALAALLVAAACWTAPAIDQIENSPGNLTMTIRTAEHRGSALGAAVGWHAVARSVGVRPWWLYVPASEWERKTDVRLPASERQTDTAIAILGGLVLLALLAAYVRRRDLFAAALIGLGMTVAIGLEAASNPSGRLLAGTLAYTTWWGSELGMWVWLILAWALSLGAVALARRLLRAYGARARDRARSLPAWAPHARTAAVALGTLASLGGVVAIGFAVAKTEKPDSHQYEYRSINRTVAAVARVIPRNQTVAYHFGPLGPGTQPMEPGIRFLMVRRGDRMLANGSFPRLGSYYEQGDRPYQWILYLTDRTDAQPQMRLVSRVRFRSRWGAEVLSAWVRRGPPSAAARAHPGRRSE